MHSDIYDGTQNFLPTVPFFVLGRVPLTFCKCFIETSTLYFIARLFTCDIF